MKLSISEYGAVCQNELTPAAFARLEAGCRKRTYIRYDVFGQDCPENRLIQGAVLLLRDRTRSFRTAALLRALAETFVAAGPIRESDFAAAEICRNDGYGDALQWSAIFLRGRSFSIFSGRQRALALMYPMDRLFEAYAAKRFKETAQSVRVFAQKSSLLFEAKSTRVRPDIILQSEGGKSSIIDTKWKRVAKETDIASGDLYQSYVYSHCYCAPVTLLYPYCGARPPLAWHRGDIRIRARFWDVLGNDQELAELLREVRETPENASGGNENSCFST